MTDFEPRDVFLFGYGICSYRAVSQDTEELIEFYLHRTLAPPVHLVLVMKSVILPMVSIYATVQVKNYIDMLGNGPITVCQYNLMRMKTMPAYKMRSVHVSLEQLKHGLDTLFPKAKWAWSPTSRMKVGS